MIFIYLTFKCQVVLVSYGKLYNFSYVNWFFKILLDQLIIKCFTPLPNAPTNSPDSPDSDSLGSDSLESGDSDSETPDSHDSDTLDSGSPDSVESDSETPESPYSSSPDLGDSSGSLLNQAVNRLIQKRTEM